MMDPNIVGWSDSPSRSTECVVAKATFKSTLKAVGQRVRASRVRAGLTQEKAAASAGIGYKRYQRIESGDVNLTLRTVYRLAKALHLDFWTLFDRGSEEESP